MAPQAGFAEQPLAAEPGRTLGATGSSNAMFWLRWDRRDWRQLVFIGDIFNKADKTK